MNWWLESSDLKAQICSPPKASKHLNVILKSTLKPQLFFLSSFTWLNSTHLCSGSVRDIGKRIKLYAHVHACVRTHTHTPLCTSASLRAQYQYPSPNHYHISWVSDTASNVLSGLFIRIYLFLIPVKLCPCFN